MGKKSKSHLIVWNTARLTFTGTHKGDFMEHAGTGKPLRVFAIDILRIRGRRIVEDRHLEDKLTLLQQLGIVSLEKQGFVDATTGAA